MGGVEPTNLKIILARLAFYFYGESVYKEFAECLPLIGDERVLDFECCMGAVAYYVAKRLPLGQLTCESVSRRWLTACFKTLRRYCNVSFLQCKPEFPVLDEESFDLVYCHCVLHDISINDMEHVIYALVKCLKVNGIFIFREPLDGMKKLTMVKNLVIRSGMSLKDSRITDIPLIGNTLESTYIKNEGRTY